MTPSTKALNFYVTVCPKCTEELPRPTVQEFGHDRAKWAAHVTTPQQVRCTFGQGRPNACGWSGTAVFARYSDVEIEIVSEPIATEGEGDAAPRRGLRERLVGTAETLLGRSGVGATDPNAAF